MFWVIMSWTTHACRASTPEVTVSEPTAEPEFPLHVLEDDETVPPRPEEELADIERAEPDPH